MSVMLRRTEPRHLEFKIAIAVLKMYKSPDIDEFLADLIQAEG
jgi:hypothetical protein